MRLKSVYISKYKNLKEFRLVFNGDSFIDVFVGKNGSGKSNLFEAIIEIFRHLYEHDKAKTALGFDYALRYEIDGTETEVAWKADQFIINGRKQKTIGKTLLPDNVLIYYSGHNNTVNGVVQRYEDTFRKRIKGANLDESRRFIGIGPEYKQLLLAVLLVQQPNNKARRFVCHKLGIDSVAPEMKLILQRPLFADGRMKFLGAGNIDDFDPRTHYWGADGITLQFLDKLKNCVKDAYKHSNLYNSTEDRYQIPIDIELFQKHFANEQTTELFRKFDNLKTLGMLAGMSIPLQLTSGDDVTTAHFSDGQFQSVYIYSIIELFKDRNCITLLDEPDAFLHPEWQFDFLKQVFDITDSATQNNHILMSSHSASTITTASDSVINLFECNGNNVVVTKANKSDVIRSLTAGLITFSESEARLNIHHVLKNTAGTVLFTEGITDEMILETAWSKLYPGEMRDFEIQNAFSCGFLRNLVNDKTLYNNHPGRTFFSIFDFDEAYNDWNQLGQDVQTDPSRCLAKKHANHDSFALLLPVPVNGQIRQQVINHRNGGNYGNRSLLTIELLFHGITGLESFFVEDTKRTDNFFKFVNDTQKVTFAKDVVPTLDTVHFEIFKPIFESIKTRCYTTP